MKRIINRYTLISMILREKNVIRDQEAEELRRYLTSLSDDILLHEFPCEKLREGYYVIIENDEELTHDEFKYSLKKLFNSLSRNFTSDKLAQFRTLIDRAKKTEWFIMPKKGTRVYKTYYDDWN